MENILLMKKSKELEELSKQLGFSKVLFLDDLTVVKGKSKKELLKKVKEARGKLTLYKAESEELLRFALEKTSIDIVYGQEMINPKDSVHFVRGGIDQITCKITRDKEKTMAFSFSDILNSSNRGKLLARIAFNIKLCKKYKVKMIFSNFSLRKEEIRSAKDLTTFFRLLSESKKII